MRIVINLESITSRLVAKHARPERERERPPVP